MDIAMEDGDYGAFELYLNVIRRKALGYERQVQSALLKFCKKSHGTATFPSGLTRRLLQLHAAKMHPSRRQLLAYGDGADECFDQKDLVRIAKRARELKDDLRKLKRTHLVFILFQEGQIADGDLLHPPIMDDQTFSPLNLTLDLPHVAFRYNKKHHPRIDHHLRDLCSYVHQVTGGWNDSLIVDILSPLEIPHTDSVDMLKRWRHSLPVKRKAEPRSTSPRPRSANPS